MPSVALHSPSLSGRAGWSLFLLAFAHLILAIDFTIVYIALPEIGSQMGFSGHNLQWVIHGYTVAFGGFLLLGGRASDLLGRRRVFVAALVLFGVASLLGGFASHPTTMVLARALQGIGAAFIFPSTLALINSLFAEGSERVKALSVWSLFGSSGLALGSLLGGVLVSAFGWTSVFLVNVPLTILTAIGAMVTMPADKPRTGSRSFDAAGAATVTIGVTLLVTALVEGPALGWTSNLVLSAAGLSLLALIAFVLIESRGKAPLMPLTLLRSRNLQIAMVLTAIFMGTFMAMPYFETLLFQQVFGYSPLTTGLAFLVPCLAQAAGTQLGARMTQSLGMRRTVVSGFVIGAVGTAAIGFGIWPGLGYLAILPGLIIASIGQGIAWGPIWIAVATGVEEHQQGVASAIASTTFQVGGAIGLALLVGVATSAATTTPASAEMIQVGTRLATYAATIGITIGALLAMLLQSPATQGEQS
ncbi:MFS transporter [Pseudoduganella sp. FT26W]|uniref:MFS transporter n=1 Tax=Duganella aquatilis TaxID=2666082 RepID=A0A844DGH1_9BURK|nr:MFS transporter [Duganella aquatilis]MRW87389.1 MFS transporter [Duganella aquatilis]